MVQEDEVRSDRNDKIMVYIKTRLMLSESILTDIIDILLILIKQGTSK
jgi:hypothetical protein